MQFRARLRFRGWSLLVTHAQRPVTASCLARRCPSAPLRAGHGVSTEFTIIQPKAQRVTIPLDDRYAAGLFDGEGYIRVNRWAKPGSIHVRYQLFGGIGMAYLPVIQALQATYGGTLNVNRHSVRNPVHRDQFQWNFSSQIGAAFLRRVLPHLVVKRDEAELALELQSSIDEWKHKLGHHHALHPRRDEIFAEREDLARRIAELKHVRFSL
jgi:hypothetical protein